jgi:hypothetical protein
MKRQEERDRSDLFKDFFFPVAKIIMWFGDEYKVRKEQRWNLLTRGKPQYWQQLQYDTCYMDGGEATRFLEAFRRIAKGPNYFEKNILIYPLLTQ